MSRPPRFALVHPVSADGIAVIEGAELHHLRDVMRLREGAEVALLAADCTEYIGRIYEFEIDRALVRVSRTIAAREAEPLILAAAVIKGSRMDFIVEKAAELGATELWPILCARGVARSPGVERVERWRRLAMAAAKQSLAPAPLQVRDPMSFTDLIRAAAKDRLAEDTLALLCSMGAEPLASVIRQRRPRVIIVACGPEGDFDPAEITLATQAGFVAAGLGGNRLRSETAAIAAISIVAGILDELRGGQ